MTDDLQRHLAESYELPEEWQQWLDTDPREDGFAEAPAPRTPEVAWRIDNDHVATWALRKLADAEREILRVTDLAMTEVERVKQWLEQASKRPARDAEFFRSHLAAYWRRQVDALMAPMLERGMTPEEAWDELKSKSLSLPTGKLTARRTPPGVEVVDEEAFVRWAQENGYTELLLSKPALNEIKALPVIDGEVVVLVGVEADDAGGSVEVPSPVPGVKPKPVEFRFDAKPDTPDA
jgi:hypothetical protein